MRKVSQIFPTYISDKLCTKSDQKTRAKQVGYFRLYISDKMYAKSDQKTRAKQVGYFRLIYPTKCMLSRTKIHAQNKSNKTFLSDFFVSDMVPMSYLRQNRKVSRDFRDKRIKSKES